MYDSISRQLEQLLEALDHEDLDLPAVHVALARDFLEKIIKVRKNASRTNGINAVKAKANHIKAI